MVRPLDHLPDLHALVTEVEFVAGYFEDGERPESALAVVELLVLCLLDAIEAA